MVNHWHLRTNTGDRTEKSARVGDPIQSASSQSTALSLSSEVPGLGTANAVKAPIHKLGFMDAGVEMVPVKELADQMSTGVSYYEQFVWDLEQRGVADIDIPVLILGVACD